MKKEFSTNDHIHPDNGKNPHNQDSPQNGTWNDHQLEQLFGEAFGDIPAADETRKAWQTFIRRHRIRHQSIRRITIPGIAAAVIALVLVFQPFLQPDVYKRQILKTMNPINATSNNFPIGVSLSKIITYILCFNFSSLHNTGMSC